MSDTQLTLLLDDMRQLIEKHTVVSRDFYREHGAFSEKVWNKFFPTFKDFVAAAGGTTVNTNPEKQSFHGNTWDISLPKTTIHTLPELLEYCKVDLGIWEVERFVVNKWEMGFTVGTGDDKKADKLPLYQVKATLVKRKEIVDARKEIERLKKELIKSSPLVKSIHIRHTSAGNVLELDIPDAHFGKMAWAKETGGPSYDTPIAAATFKRAVEVLLRRAEARGLKFDKIILVVGNDLLNSDNEQGTTTKGTFVSTDGRYQKTFVTVRETITWTIERCRQVAPVRVIMVSGNHDDLGVWHLGDSLECLYTNVEDVEIDNAPTARKYFRYQNVFLMFTHGDKGKREDYPLLMATERSKDFGETKYREIHTGHIHQTKLQEWHGVRVRILPSLSPPDAWHSENGFTGQQRVAESFIWNGQEGLIGMDFYNDEAYPAITTDRVTREG